MSRTHDRETAPQTARKPYPSDVGDDEWAFVAPYLTLMDEGAPQREHPLREALNGLRWIVRTGARWRMMPNDLPPWHMMPNDLPPWRMMPNDLPPWHAVYQQTRRLPADAPSTSRRAVYQQTRRLPADAPLAQVRRL